MSQSIRGAMLIFVMSLVRSVVGAEPDVSGLIQALQSKNASERADQALLDLRELGLDAAPALPQVLSIAEDPKNDLQVQAVRVISGMGADAAPAIPKLIPLLREDDDPWISTDVGFPCLGAEAALALAAIGRPAVEPLIRCLEDQDRVVRFYAAYTLGKIGPKARKAVPALLKSLNDRQAVVQMQAVWSIACIAPDDAQVVSAISAKVKDKVFFVRREAVDALTQVRPMTQTVLDVLIGALEDEEGSVQDRAARAIGGLGPDAAPAVPALTKLLRSRNIYVEGHPGFFRPVAKTAAWALGRIGRDAKAAIPSLLDVTRNTDGSYDELGVRQNNWPVRAAAARAAARIDPDNPEVLHVLQESLQSDRQIREAVVRALALLGAKAKPALPILLEFLDDESSRKVSLACAVLSIQPENAEIQDVLLKEMETDGSVEYDDWPLLQAIFTHGGRKMRRAVPALVKLLSSANFRFLDPAVSDPVQAARLLAQFGPDSSPAIGALTKLLNAYRDEYRREAAAAIWRIDSKPQEFFDKAIKKGNLMTRRNIVEALHGLPEATPLLVAALDDPSGSVRLAAVSALDPKHLDAHNVLAVKKLLGDRYLSIREAAADVLRRSEFREVPTQ